MPARTRPLLAVRLIGPAAAVRTHVDDLLARLAECYGDQAVCRRSVHHASYAGEIRAYLTVTPKGDG